MARNRSKHVDTTEEQVGQAGVVTFEDNDKILDQADVEPVQVMLDKEHAANLAFNNELVTVMVHPSTDRNAEQIVFVSVNGRRQFFPRGVKVTCKRMFVERLALCKETSYRNEEYQDASGGRAVRYPKGDGLKYPFNVERDDNPRGAEWLRKLLALPA